MDRPGGLPWLPGFGEDRCVFAFSSKLIGINIFGECASLTPELVLSKGQGFQEVGLFSRTKDTIDMFAHIVMNSLRPVVSSQFAEKSRGHESLREPFLAGVACLTGLAWAFVASLAVLASVFMLSVDGE